MSPVSVTMTGQRLLHGFEPASPALKRTCLESLEKSPAKVKRTEASSKVSVCVPVNGKFFIILKNKNTCGGLQQKACQCVFIHIAPVSLLAVCV